MGRGTCSADRRLDAAGAMRIAIGLVFLAASPSTAGLLGAPKLRRGLCSILLGSLPPAGLSAQETETPLAEEAIKDESKGSQSVVKIGPEHSVSQELRYAVRENIGSQGVVVDFSVTPVNSRKQPPPLSDLVGDAARQDAIDRNARPGDFITPPAVLRNPG